MRDFPLRSALTPLQTLPDCFFKRDDELHPAGSKIRKLATLIPALASQQRPVWLAGGLNSNSIIAAAPLLQEAGLCYRVLTPRYHKLYANGILACQILAPDQIKTVLPAALAPALAALRRLASAGQLTLIEEGLDHPAAYEGAASLAADLRRNEQAQGLDIRHVFVDSGSGLMAAGLIAGDLRLGIRRHYHIVLAAGSEAQLYRQLAHVTAHIRPTAGEAALRALPISFYRPLSGRSFGSTPAAVWDTIRQVARSEGVLLDPIYTAKTFQVLEQQAPRLAGTKVMVHSGGTGSLAGFLDKLTITSSQPFP